MPIGRRSPNGKKRIVAFVDYEHWYFSMNNIHNAKPDIATWFEDLSSRGRVVDVIFFGDFTQVGLRDEIGKIRAYSNKIIETRNPNPRYKKDYTDFIMLDNIYQRALSSEGIDTFVIFSGDGHFSSVASFLKNFYHREVGIYAVAGAVSKLLRAACDWCVEMPDSAAKERRYTRTVLETIDKLEKKKIAYVTSGAVVNMAAKDRPEDREEYSAAIEKLVKGGYIRTREVIVKGKPARILYADWEKIEAEESAEG